MKLRKKRVGANICWTFSLIIYFLIQILFWDKMVVWDSLKLKEILSIKIHCWKLLSLKLIDFPNFIFFKVNISIIFLLFTLNFKGYLRFNFKALVPKLINKIIMQKKKRRNENENFHKCYLNVFNLIKSMKFPFPWL